MSLLELPQEQRSVPVQPTGPWKLEDAKARFSEVVRLAQTGVPQHVSVRGRDAVVILSVADYERLAPAATGSLLSLFADGPFGMLDDFDASVVREPAVMRDAPVFEP